jgi:hypothetical protein
MCLVLRVIFAFVFLFFSNSYAFSQDKAPNEVSTTSNPSSEQMRLLQEQLVLLKAQNEAMKTYQSSVSDILVSSTDKFIQVSSGIAGFLLFFSWWTNFKLNEKDVQRLQQSIDLQVNRIDLRINNVTSDTSSQISNLVNKMSSSEKNIYELIKLSDQRTTEVINLIESKYVRLDNNLNNRFSELSLHVARLKSVESYMWEQKDSLAMQLYTLYDKLDLSLKSDNKPIIFHTLEDFNILLGKLVAANEVSFSDLLINRLKSCDEKLNSVEFESYYTPERVQLALSTFRERISLLKASTETN